MRVVYADVVLLLNFSLDFASLYACCMILRILPNFKRMCVSSLVGALLALLIISFNLNRILSIIASLPATVLMTYINFGKSSKKLLIKRTLVMYTSSALICASVITLGSSFIFGNDSLFAVLVSVLVCALCFVQSRVFTQKQKAVTDRVIIQCAENAAEFVLYRDSANFLTDPYVGLPVIMLNGSAKQKIMLSDENITEFKPRYIPIKTAAGSSVVFAIVPTEICVLKRNEKLKIKAVVAFAKEDMLKCCVGDGVIPTCLTENL